MLFTSVLAFATLALALPVEKRQNSGAYDGGQAVTDSKNEIAGQGGDALNQAVNAAEYGNGGINGAANGVNDPNKTGDSSVWGPYNENWGALRNTCDRFKGQPAEAYQNGAVLNTDTAGATACFNQLRMSVGDQNAVDINRNGCPTGNCYGTGGATSLTTGGDPQIQNTDPYSGAVANGVQNYQQNPNNGQQTWANVGQQKKKKMVKARKE